MKGTFGAGVKVAQPTTSTTTLTTTTRTTTQTSYTLVLPAGTYTYVCDVPFHVDRGMTGALTVTP